MFDYALREVFPEGLESACTYFGVSLELGWNVGQYDTYYVYVSEVNEGVTVIKWDEVLNLDFEIKRLGQNVRSMP